MDVLMENTAIKDILASGTGFTTRQAVASGISRQSLCDYCKSGRIVRLSRGVYLPVGNDVSESPEIEALQRKGTDFVLCLLSALKFHGIGTQNPPGIWIAILNSRHAPSVDFKLECIRFGERFYNSNVAMETANGLPLKVYTPARTVVDCFRFRNRIGLDTAMEALRDGWHKKLFTSDELYGIARTCRIANVLRPYMEMMLA